jgi:hypothetical protein
MPRCFLAAWALTVAVPIAARAAPQADADRVLVGMREAIGADAIADVRAFSIKATVRERALDTLRKHDEEWTCMLPDRCIAVVSYTSFLVNVTHTVGFTADRLVWFPGYRPPRKPAAPPPQMNAEWAVTALKRQFNRLAVLLLGDAPFHPYAPTWLGLGVIDGRSVDVLALKSSDGDQLRLHTDRATHLPVMISWSEWMTGEHQLYVDDFRKVDGLLWPRHMIEYAHGEVMRDVEIRKYSVNPEPRSSILDAPRASHLAPRYGTSIAIGTTTVPQCSTSSACLPSTTGK